MPRSRFWIFEFTVGLAFLVLGWFAAPADGADHARWRSAMSSITSSDLKRYVSVLADDAFEGRAAGSRGGHAAGIYLVRQLGKLGLSGAGEGGGYFQSFGSGYRNVLAWVAGSDPHLRHEVILVGAHYDHVGYGTPQNSYGPFGYIHNGADDNASGTAALLEVAEALARFEPRPRRSILLAWWDGEEEGLLGSEHWVRHPTVLASRVRMAVNLDMVGRLRHDHLEVSGTRTLAGLRHMVARENQGLDLKLDFTWEVADNSDHYSFFKRSIPFLMFHTGLHKDYHRPSDDVERINFPGMQRISRLLLGTIYELANQEHLGGFRVASRRETPAEQRRLLHLSRPLRRRFGVSWDPHERQDHGIRITRVVAGSAADQAGLHDGDRLVQFAGHAISSPETLRSLVLSAGSPVSVVIERAGTAVPLALRVTLSGKPVRLGIAWRMDDAEPGAVILTRVVPGSPADQAALKVGDRIYEVGGRAFAQSEEFAKLARESSSPVVLRVEREGHIREARLELSESRDTPASGKDQDHGGSPADSGGAF